MNAAASLCRVIVVGFWLATAAYAFLASVPFVYEQFLAPGLVPALAAFARWHGWLALAVAAPTALVVWPDARNWRAPLSAAGLVWVAALGGVAAAVASPLLDLRPGAGALAASIGALVPVLWLAAIDLRLVPARAVERKADLTGRDALVVAGSAATVVLLHAVLGARAVEGWPALGLVQSAAAQFVLFAAVFALFAAIRAAAELTGAPARWEAAGATVLLAAFFAAPLWTVVIGLSTTGWASRAAVLAFAGALAAAVAARGLRAGRVRDQDGLSLAMSGLVPRWAESRAPLPRLVWAVAVIGAVLALRRTAGTLDWNFALAKLSAVLAWVMALATLLQWAPAHVRLPAPAPFAVSLALLAAYLAAAGRIPGGPVGVEAATRAGETWAAADPSFRTVRDWLHRSDVEAPDAAADGVGFFDFLQAHTNIARSMRVAPVELRLADLAASAPAATRPPHVFVFVIDSLRRDYLSPYNEAVDFTPAISAFARESVVYTKAFTRYGATGLSVPSMWVGGMVLHKQYVTPFAPMNTLHALLDHHRYRRWMSVDNIVNVITPRVDALEPLDARRGVEAFRFCSTLDEVRARLARLTADAPPTFVWSLPQDIHVAVIAREGAGAVDGGTYGRFHAPTASRIRRFDACFGAFVDDLKARGLYDDSVIVLTADHGDSLGEDGRWGHAYTVTPEVLQVPLLVHLPPRLRDGVDTDPAALAFTTDITPTLYALLGHQVASPSPIFGQPLVWRRGTAPPAPTTFGLVASSYGSVYGWIDTGGRELYVADGVAFRDAAFALDGSAAGAPLPVTPALRRDGQRAIRDGITAIAEVWRFTPPR